jgi:cysteine-S-conjugate beta-lyase
MIQLEGRRMDGIFDRHIERIGTDSYKWNMNRQMFGTDDVLPMWVADMDFRAPQEVIDAIIERASHGVFGYPYKPDSFFEAVQGWFERQYGWTIRREWIVATPGVVPALCTAITAFTEPGDGVIYQPPVYYLFASSVRNNGRKQLENRLIEYDGEYSFDLDDLQEKAAQAKMLVLCSPHNPVGRVWTRGELKNVLKICRDNDILLFSDEIHADLIFPGNRHVPAGLPGTIKEDLICAYSTSKTFNLAGLGMSINVIPGRRTREKFQEALQASSLWMTNIFGRVGTEAAYARGDSWLQSLMNYVDNNFEIVKNELAETVPQIGVSRPQATYLLWLDCRRMGMNDDELEDFFVRKARLGLDAGRMFGPGGEGYMRMNIACPRSTIHKAIDRLAVAWQS